jgi:hypothetical protein
MTIERLKDSFAVKYDTTRATVASFLLLSDLHLDSPKTDRSKVRRVLTEAVERGAKIFLLGDLMDLMGGKYDPRTGKNGIRPEHNVHNYYQAVIEDTYEFLKPFKDDLMFMCQGNHETGVTKRHEIDPLGMLAWMLRGQGWTGEIGDYEGWVRFKSRRHTQHYTYQKTMFYSHGTGGSSPVTRGVIQTNRRQVNINADIFVSGHIHTTWAFPVPQRFLNQSGVEEIREVLHLQLGTSKESHKDRNGWEAHKGFGPPSLGGYYLNLGLQKDTYKAWEERVSY